MNVNSNITITKSRCFAPRDYNEHEVLAELAKSSDTLKDLSNGQYLSICVNYGESQGEAAHRLTVRTVAACEAFISIMRPDGTEDPADCEHLNQSEVTDACGLTTIGCDDCGTEIDND